MSFLVITVKDPFGEKITTDIFGDPIPEEMQDAMIWVIKNLGKTTPDFYDADNFCIAEVDTEREVSQLVMAHLETMRGKKEIEQARLARTNMIQ